MPTRADFYVGRGKSAEWIGSTACDGYPDNKGFLPIFNATTKEEYLDAVTEAFKEDNYASLPEHGWPWPWDNSQLTDYTYAFEDSKVYASAFGRGWFDPLEKEPEFESNGDKVEMPDMSALKNPTLGKRSGLIVL